MKKQVLTFQKIIQILNSFWAEHGCIIGEPYGLEVGAGTANPLTFFRALGPEPFSVAYVEPSRRPDDGRYGENPNRLQHYYQYQIILKPVPLFNQELFIQMLMELGINPEEHDLRFVEDNWESPAIGAWGLGWEVWLDGMEIAQYTYFQQVAGIPLEVPTLEITLGLERIAMYIQNVDNYKDILWNQIVKYGDLFTQHEYWQSKYNFEDSSVDQLQKLFDIHLNLTTDLIDKGNYWASYDNLLKVSHIFNVLDARGAVSLTDRVQKFQLMGKLSKRIGDLYISERENLGYPMLKEANQILIDIPTTEIQDKRNSVENSLLIELGFEELPSEYVIQWYRAFNKNKIIELLKTKGFNISVSDIRFGLTPLRLVIEISNIAEKVSLTEIVVGPTKIASFRKGEPTSAIIGFTKKYGKSVEDVKWVDRNGRELATLTIVNETSIDHVANLIIEFVISIAPRTKFMRWDLSNRSFIRPLRHLLALYGDKNLDISFWNISSEDWTIAPRYVKPTLVKIKSIGEYEAFLDKYDIVLDAEDRYQKIKSQIEVDVKDLNMDYLWINVGLVESPSVKLVKLPRKFNILPRELITKVLEKHQKYIIVDTNENLLYGIVANANKPTSTIYDGNAKVVDARLEDALFYYNQDSKHKLIELRKNLKGITFHKNVGSYYDKAIRIVKLLNEINHGFDYKGIQDLIYNDKATTLVTEFPDLEGVIGYYYALRDGYDNENAVLLKEMRYKVSTYSEKGRFLALIDRLDTLSSLAFAGELPEGSNDPYEVRRLVYEILDLVTQHINIASIIELDLSILTHQFPKQNINIDRITTDILDFVFRRIVLILKEKDLALPDRIIKGVAYGGRSLRLLDIYSINQTYNTLSKLFKENPNQIDKLFDAIKRIDNIISKYQLAVSDNINSSEGFIDTSLFENSVESELNDWDLQTFDSKSISEMIKILDRFFENVMVMVDDEKVRVNRVNLLRKVLLAISKYIDPKMAFSKSK